MSRRLVSLLLAPSSLRSASLSSTLSRLVVVSPRVRLSLCGNRPQIDYLLFICCCSLFTAYGTNKMVFFIILDLGSPNCERMTPIRFAEYVEAYFKTQSSIKMSIIKDVDILEQEYPLLHAVARCSLSGIRTGVLVFGLQFMQLSLLLSLTPPRFLLCRISSQTLPSCCQARVQVG